MKRPEPNPESINVVADNVTRQSNEPEDMDLAAEATSGAPAKSLVVNRKGNRRAKPNARTKTASGSAQRLNPRKSD